MADFFIKPPFALFAYSVSIPCHSDHQLNRLVSELARSSIMTPRGRVLAVGVFHSGLDTLFDPASLPFDHRQLHSSYVLILDITI